MTASLPHDLASLVLMVFLLGLRHGCGDQHCRAGAPDGDKNLAGLGARAGRRGRCGLAAARLAVFASRGLARAGLIELRAGSNFFVATFRIATKHLVRYVGWYSNRARGERA